MHEKQLNYIRTDLYSFYRYYVARSFKENINAPHIEKLSTSLMELYRGDYKRLCVAMPPRHSKSSMITEAFPLWLIFHNPSLNILIVSNSSGLSEKFGIALRELIKKYGAEFNIYLSDVKSSSTYLMFNNSEKNLYYGSIRLVGAGGSITGQDVDYLIIDDPYEGFNDITPGLLEKKINWFKTIIEQRIEPHTRLVILHTRWHSDDLQGYLKENEAEDYKFITFPAILENGQPLWPERYTIQDLEKKRESLGLRLFNSIFQQQPIDNDTNFFNLKNIQWNTIKEYKTSYSCRAWDTASSQTNGGDYTVGVKMHLTKKGEYVITDIVRGKYGNKTKDIIFDNARNDGVDTIVVIETGVAAAGKFLYEEWVSQIPGYFVEQAKPLTSKVDRATPFKNAILDGKIYINIEDDNLREDLIQEFKAFPDGRHDDIVDACAHAYNYLTQYDGGFGLDIARIKIR